MDNENILHLLMILDKEHFLKIEPNTGVLKVGKESFFHTVREFTKLESNPGKTFISEKTKIIFELIKFIWNVIALVVVL